jgi:hypothetical protein
MSPPHKDDVIAAKTWAEFREAGMMWFANRILHVFGWAIIIEIDDETGTEKVYPARTVWRGFSPDREALGFKRVTQFMVDNASALQAEVDEE